MSNWKVLVAVYVAAALTTGQMAYRLNESQGRLGVPVEYIILGAGWPVVGLLFSIRFLFGK